MFLFSGFENLLLEPSCPWKELFFVTKIVNIARAQLFAHQIKHHKGRESGDKLVFVTKTIKYNCGHIFEINKLSRN